MQVQINFLPVGHTHEDVDQLFSRIGERIRKGGCESLPGERIIYILYYTCILIIIYTVLLASVHSSYTPNPTVSMVDGVWDFKSYFEPYLNKMQGHSKYGAFRFTKAADDQARNALQAILK